MRVECLLLNTDCVLPIAFDFEYQMCTRSCSIT